MDAAIVCMSMNSGSIRWQSAERDIERPKGEDNAAGFSRVSTEGGLGGTVFRGRR